MPRPLGGHVFNQPASFSNSSNNNGASRVKNAPPLGSHVFKANFHEDRKIIVASGVLTRKKCPAPGGHVFPPTGIILELVQDIIGMNLQTKFYEDQTINGAFRKNAPPLGSHVFQATQMLMTHDTQRTKGDHKAHHEHVVLR
ncbi:hypothetical protein DPMN_151378 [Dreissena polymorpha]|uniref:Uncharacterized protein n=1 Tax=Dreissena polymorpha TaxID=45954 RepID=A0A9D4FH10_DREPO|nr:hypothetical protein DPMN_151378 [Dreissena polymorpha]